MSCVKDKAAQSRTCYVPNVLISILADEEAEKLGSYSDTQSEPANVGSV